MKKILLWVAGVLVVLGIGIGIYAGPTISRFLKITSIVYDANLRIVLGSGGNSAVLKTGDNKQVLIVDTKMGRGAKELKRYVDSLGPDVKITIVNTHDHPDHAGGNTLFPQAYIIAGAYSDEQWKKEVSPKLPDERVAAGLEIVLTFGNEIVRICNLGQAHTSNDMVVYFVNRHLLHAGDLVFNGWYPVLRKDSGANVAKWIQALETILVRYHPKVVLPGHGPLADQNVLVAERDYFSSIYAAIGDQVKLEELRKKYSGYFSLLHMTGFDQTVKFIGSEKNHVQETPKPGK